MPAGESGIVTSPSESGHRDTDTPPTPVQAPADPTAMSSFAADMWVGDAAVLTDVDLLTDVLRAAAEIGHATVLAEALHVFPNGAVTASLVLSQSHLSIHTWPEFRLLNVDLLTCGPLNGELILGHIEQALDVKRTNLTRVARHAFLEPDL